MIPTTKGYPVANFQNRKFSMGQEGPFFPPDFGEQAVPELERITSIEQWIAEPWTKEEAIAMFNVTNLLWSFREKIAFSSIYFKQLISNPGSLSAIRKSPDGEDFIKNSSTLINLSQELSKPNPMTSIRNLLQALETKILPGFGVGVRGMRPLLRKERAITDCVRVDPPRNVKEVIDFGNLCETSILSDMDALRISLTSIQEIAPEVKLGNPIGALALAIVWIVGAILVTITVSVGGVALMNAWGRNVRSALDNPEFQKWLAEYEKTHPQEAAKIRDQEKERSQYWADTVLKAGIWIAAGLGVLGIGFLVYSLMKE